MTYLHQKFQEHFDFLKENYLAEYSSVYGPSSVPILTSSEAFLNVLKLYIYQNLEHNKQWVFIKLRGFWEKH
jgi:hypothetical protein